MFLYVYGTDPIPVEIPRAVSVCTHTRMRYSVAIIITDYWLLIEHFLRHEYT
jgi:hypothetical protein